MKQGKRRLQSALLDFLALFPALPPLLISVLRNIGREYRKNRHYEGLATKARAQRRQLADQMYQSNQSVPTSPPEEIRRAYELGPALLAEQAQAVRQQFPNGTMPPKIKKFYEELVKRQERAESLLEILKQEE